MKITDITNYRIPAVDSNISGDPYDLDVEIKDGFNGMVNQQVQTAEQCHTIGCKTQPSMCKCSGLAGVCRF